MDSNTKSFIKSTILGLLGGGALSAGYAMAQLKKDKEDPSKSTADRIVVPLSKRNFMSVLSKKTTNRESTPEENTNVVPAEKMDVSSMSSRDIEALKRDLLRKRAACSPTSLSKVSGPVSYLSSVKRVSGKTVPRDELGRFSTEGRMNKKAFLFDGAGATIASSLGAGAGFAVGVTAVKAVTDRILENRKKADLENSRRVYADLLKKEVNDDDAPYYSKYASDKGMFGPALGYVGLTGIGTAGLASLIMYKVLEKRRKDLEDAADKDLDYYPAEKTINFKFAEEDGRRSFFV